MHIYTFFEGIQMFLVCIFLSKSQNWKRVLYDYKTYTWAGSVSYAIEDKCASRRILDWTSTRFGLNCDAIRIELRRDSDWTATHFEMRGRLYFPEVKIGQKWVKNWSKKNSAKTTNLILVRWFCGKKLVFNLGIPLKYM